MSNLVTSEAAVPQHSYGVETLKYFTPGFANGSRTTVKREALLQSPLFRNSPLAEIDRLAGYARLVSFERNMSIFQQDDEATALMIVLSGSVKLCLPSHENQQSVIDLIKPGETMGEIALLEGHLHLTDAIAMTSCQIIYLDRRHVMPFFLQNVEVTLRLLNVFCTCIRRNNELLRGMMFNSSAARLAEVILRLAIPDEHGMLHVTATQKELGHFVGIVRENINKQLHVWSVGGWIVVHKGGLIIKKSAELKKLVTPN